MNPNTILESLTRVADLAKKINHIELHEQLMGLRELIVTLREDNVRLREENISLQAQVTARTSMHFDGTVYWSREAGKPPADGPYCPRCRDSTQKDVRVHAADGMPWLWMCLTCKETYGVNHGYRDPNDM